MQLADERDGNSALVDRCIASGGAPDQIGPLTVVIVCDHAYVSGGLARVALGSARGLHRAGHRVVLFAATNPVEQSVQDAGVEVICLNQPDMLGDPSALRAASRAIWNVAAARSLRSLLRSLPRDTTIVHAHGWSKALSPSVLKIAAASGLATVQTMHDYVSFCPNGALYNFVKKSNCYLKPMSWQCIKSNCDARSYRDKAWRVTRHVALGWADMTSPIRDLIYLTERQRQIVEPLMPPGKHLHYVTNPVETPKQPPADVASNKRFVAVGRLSAEKGSLLLAAASKQVGAEIEFVGDGPLTSNLRHLLPDASMTGWLAGPATIERIRAARALVFPSLWHETFGLAVHEALANGVPVIVSDNTVCAELIRHGENGLLFRSGDRDHLATQMRLLADPDVAVRMGRAGYDLYWKAAPTLDRHVRELENVYRRVLARFRSDA